jgi:dienelactone hydrolase
MGSLVHVSLGGPSIILSPRPASAARPADAPFVEAWRSVAGAPAPGLVVVHDAWGLDAEVRALTHALAGAGFAVLAPDLAAGRRPSAVAEAEALAATIDPEDVGRVLAATIDALRADARVSRQRVGVIGLGMGAPLAAFAATLRADVAAVVLAGPGPDLPADAWGRTEAAFLLLPPAESAEAVEEAVAWADHVRALGREVVVAPAPMPESDQPPPADPVSAAEWALPGALAFFRRHLG